MTTAEDMGIRPGLVPIFCAHCGERIGWGTEEPVYAMIYCEECAKEDEDNG